jgi:hypothetical protein
MTSAIAAITLALRDLMLRENIAISNPPRAEPNTTLAALHGDDATQLQIVKPDKITPRRLARG